MLLCLVRVKLGIELYMMSLYKKWGGEGLGVPTWSDQR
jgi:hypothetical protein